MTQEELHWFAGLMEGEGTFFVQKNYVGKKCYYYPQLSILMSDRDVIERVGELVDAKVFSYQPPLPSKKRLYRVTLLGRRAVWWMKRLLPLMGKRRAERITGILEGWDSRIPTDISRRKSCQLMVVDRKRDELGQFIAKRKYKFED